MASGRVMRWEGLGNGLGLGGIESTGLCGSPPGKWVSSHIALEGCIKTAKFHQSLVQKPAVLLVLR